MEAGAQLERLLRHHLGRVDEVAGVGREVFVTQVAADAFEVSIDRFCDRAFVEGVAAAFREQVVGVGKVRVLEDLAFARRLAVDQVGALGVFALFDVLGVLREAFEVAFPVRCDQLRNREAFAGVAGCGGEDVCHRQLAEAVVQGEPAVNGTGHRYGKRAQCRDRFAIAEFLCQVLKRAALRRTTGAVVAIELLRLRIPDDREEVATDAATDRFHQSERCVRRDRGIHRAAALFQNIDRDLCRERLRGCRHAVLAEHGGARCERSAGVAVAATRCCRVVDVVGGGGSRHEREPCDGGEEFHGLDQRVGGGQGKSRSSVFCASVVAGPFKRFGF